MRNNKKDRIGLAGLMCLIFLTGQSCGYHVAKGTVPGNKEAIAIPVVKNQTPYSDLAAQLTSALRKKTAMSGIPVTAANDAPRLKVIIILVNIRPFMLAENSKSLIAVENAVSMKVEASIVDSEDSTIAGPRLFEASEKAYAGGNSLSDESLTKSALLLLLDDLADKIVTHFLIIRD